MTDQPDIILEESLRIHPIECDFNQEWKPAAIMQHLTEIAGTHAALLGVGFDSMLSNNLYWVHSRMKIKFLAIPRAGDLITVCTWPKTIYRRLLYIRDFEVLAVDGQKLIAATSAWVIINATSRRMAPPKSVNLNIPEAKDHIGLDDHLDRIDQAQNGEERLRVRAGYSAVDIVGHTNNSRYIEWICDAFPFEMFITHKLDWIQINYEHEILPGEEVSILVNPVSPDGEQWAIEGRNNSNDTRAFSALLRWRS
jgi:medium-chain acyl-[acyl-carrier-protein] hydrolase